jgi:AcrR family transcriptional regulator
VATREEFPISELVERTGVPRATIHHYVGRGVLPPPRRVAANRFMYDNKHVEGLKLIKLLRERRHLPLDVIAEVLPELLNLEGEEAFRPEMWDRAVGLRLRAGSKTTPDVRLLKAAIEAFSHHGYADVNVDDLCSAAGVAKGSLYRYFPSKEKLFFAAASHAAAEVGEGFAALKRQRDAKATEEVAEALAEALEPRLPLLLELWSRALQRRPGHASVTQEVFVTLRKEVARHLDPRDAEQMAEVVVPQAVFAVWNRMVASAAPPSALTVDPSA